MTKSKHDVLKRQCAQVYNHYEKALVSLMELELIFREQHPELAGALLAACQGTLACQEIVMKFWEKAWGKRPPDVNVWL